MIPDGRSISPTPENFFLKNTITLKKVTGEETNPINMLIYPPVKEEGAPVRECKNKVLRKIINCCQNTLCVGEKNYETTS